jgi:uncharacterized protein (TIGR02996 family)
MLVPSDDPEFIKFVTQIIADPADDTTRLVFADWLADRGDPRAPLLRVVPLVRQAAGPVETVPKLKRAKIRDPLDETRTLLGPIPKDWKSPYPSDKPPPDVTLPREAKEKSWSWRGAHGAFRLLSLAVIWDAFRGPEASARNRLRMILAGAELHACGLITAGHRNHVVNLAFLGRTAYGSDEYAAPAAGDQGTAYALHFDTTYKIVQVASLVRERSGGVVALACLGFRGSYVNVVNALNFSQAKAIRQGDGVTLRDAEWHVRVRSVKMVDVWKALTPWVDGRRAWEEKEELKQNSPPRSDQHKKYQIACGKYPCDHKLVDGRTAYVRTGYNNADRFGVRVSEKLVRCRLCDHARQRMPAGS